MNNYPEFLDINGKRYKINTDFRVALKCNEVSEDLTLNVYEKTLAIICLLFGKEALEDTENYEKLYLGAEKFLLCGKKKELNNEKPDMDYKKDMNLIRISIMTDFNGLDIENKEIHWWDFNDLMNGLSNSELGNCCILNRIRNLRNMDASKIKDTKLRQEIEKQQKYWSLDKEKEERKFTKEEQDSINSFYEQIEGR